MFWNDSLIFQSKCEQLKNALLSFPEPPLPTGMTHTGMTQSPPEAFYNLKSMPRSLNIRMEKKNMALFKKKPKKCVIGR